MCRTWRDSYQTATAFKVTVGWAVTDIYTEPVCVHGDGLERIVCLTTVVTPVS